MALYLHFETRPYFSQVKLKSKADPAALEQYFQFREQFVHEFALHCQVPGFRLSDQVVQIGKAECDFAGMSVAEVSARLQPVIDEVACAVNLTLFKLDERRRLLATNAPSGIIPVVESPDNTLGVSDDSHDVFKRDDWNKLQFL